MQTPAKIVFHEIPPSEAIEGVVRNKIDKLEEFYNRITRCRVVIEAPPRHHHKGKLYHVGIDLTVSNEEIFIGREHHDQHAHEDVYVAIRDAFHAARRRLEDYARRHRHQIKTHHDAWPEGRIAKLFPDDGYGFITSRKGHEIYFHKNSMLNHPFERIQIGDAVRFVQEEGEKGSQASSVRISG